MHRCHSLLVRLRSHAAASTSGQVWHSPMHAGCRAFTLGCGSAGSAGSAVHWAAATASDAAAAAAAAAAARGFASGARGGVASPRKQRDISDYAMYLGAGVLGMLGLSYASVPLYRMFCQATGYGGTVRQGHSVEEKLRRRSENPNPELEAKAAARELRVWFTADVAPDMPWKFKPTQEYVRVKPGQSTLVFYTAENLSDKPITGVSTYNVVPDRAGAYFNKIQCFCFEEQRLRGRETVDMPVFFYIDPEMVDDHNCRSIRDITLSYTFYKTDEGDVEDDEEAAAAPGSGVKLHGNAAGVPSPAHA